LKSFIEDTIYAKRIFILALNEVYRGSLEQVAEELHLEYTFFGPCHNNNFGNGILSTVPILDAENWILNSRSPGQHARALLRVSISLKEEANTENHHIFNIFVTHLEHISEKVRLQQMGEVIQIISNWEKTSNDLELKNGHLLLGDLNTMRKKDYSQQHWDKIVTLRKERKWIEDDSPEPLEQVIPFLEHKEYKDCWLEVGKGEFFTAWTHNPLMRIDYIFCSKYFRHSLLSCQRMDSVTQSDHFPLLVEMEIKKY